MEDFQLDGYMMNSLCQFNADIWCHLPVSNEERVLKLPQFCMRNLLAESSELF